MAPVKNHNASTNNKKNEKQKQQQPAREDLETVPIGREFKDLHDYLQTTLAKATKKQQQQRQQQQTQQQQQQPLLNEQNATVSTFFDLEPLGENQQYCFPSTSSIQQYHKQHQEPNQLPLQHRQLPSQQIEEHFLPINLLDLAACLTASAATSSSEAVTAPPPTPPITVAHTTSTAVATFSNTNISDSALLQQRLQLIQQFLNLTERTNKNYPNPFMVHEINPSPMDHEVVVNSASLEDVALSEMSDRAQSIQSLHSIETPTLETTPSYDELQQRLETSNRNIQNIQEQQQQLLRLQNTAKQHLSDMEQLRQNAGQLSFGPGSGQLQNGDASTNGDAPDYESIEQVHTDMATLVGRMKNLTSFIQDQNELSNLLGDDGPEILAEQEALQRKLESLRTQRDEMRSLVGELQDINRNAEKSVNDRKEHSEEEEMEERKPHQASSAAHERFVPVEYSRVVPIELLQAAANCKQNDSTAGAADSTAGGEENNAEAALLIQQKTADIEAMKSQLKRLKDMMETVNLIESRTARDPKDIGRTPPPPQPRDGRSQSSSSSFDRERTPLASSSSRETSATVIDDDSNDAFISRKVRMLNEVTSDLRAQAESLQTERDRIKALKDEIVRRKEQAAAAVQLGDDALKRSSLTPTPTPLSRQVQQLLNEDSLEDRDLLKVEYEVKKKEFEMLCQRLNAGDGEVVTSINNNNAAGAPVLRSSTRQDIVSEADDEAEEDLLHETNFAKKYYAAAPLPRAADVTATTNNSQARCAKDSLDSTVASSNASATRASTAAPTTAANSAHDGAASLEAASLQSGSSHSYSLPPPMASMSSWPPMPPPPLPSSWNPHFYYGLGMPPPPAPPSSHASLHTAQSYILPSHYTPPASSTARVQPIVPPTSSECLYSGGTNSAATVGAAAPTAASTTSNAAAQLAADPVLLQQFVQTQQMLINSVCQCNQMLWHQQREIDALNNTIHILQDRLFALTGPSAADLSFNLRAESVPPPTLSGALPNNLYASINRAQSEQPPTAFLPNAVIGSGAQSRSAFANYQQQQQQLYQRQRGIIGIGGGAAPGAFNYSTEMQQQNASSTNTSIYATLNNAAAQQQPPPPPSHFNNEATPQSPISASAGGPGPIFMHHHNNSIHQNNSNLRTQNHHANNLQQQQQQHHNNLASANTLNNQVPPGNRANNYWDNFRSYSRQNLLSTNSNKSNEEQQQNQQQLQQQHQQQQQQSHEPNLYQTQRATAAALRNLHLYHQSNAAAPPPPQPPPREFLGNLNWHENDIDLYDNYNILDNDVLSATYVPASASSSSNIRNMNNVNFGNSPHYQRNKVPAKQTCRPTIGLTSTLNQNRNRLEQTSSHLTRNIEDEYPMSHQQQRQETQQHFRDSPFTHQNPQQRFTLLPTSSSTSTAARSAAVNATLNTTYNLRNDFLLRTVDINDDIDGGYMPSSLLATTAATENVSADAFNVNGVVVDDDDEDDDDDDDTTSEEIKRNLLVNALKNDKFTTKFYESIKEDVFRRLESMLLEKENSSSSCTNDGWQQQQPYSEPHQQQSKPFLTQFCNDVGNSGAGAAAATDSASGSLYNSEPRSRDPLRKLYLNARMGNQQQQHQQQYFSQQLLLPQLELDLEEQEENNNADTESNNADNETLTLENLIAENEKPEDENEPCNNIAVAEGENIITGDVNGIVTASATPSNWRQNIISNVRHLEQLPKNSTTINKKRKNQQQQRMEKEEDTACSLLVFTAENGKPENERFSTTTVCGSSNSNNNSTQTPILTSPNYDLINYIITRIRNQTHANTIINDTLLVEIAKLTATAAQNDAAATATTSKLLLNTPPPNISPKRIYARIKKMSIPRQRDEFLRWYQIYLETLLVIEQYQQQREDNNAAGLEKSCKGQQQHNRKLLQKSNIPSTQKNEKETDTLKTVNSYSNNNNNNLNCNKPNIFLERQRQHNATAAIFGHNANTTTTNLQINDDDLAEADQISANTSLNGGVSQTNHNHHGLQPEDEEEDDQHAYAGHIANAMSQTIHKFKQENGAAAEVKHELEEFENNENPDEEGASAAAAEAALAPITATIADACTSILNEANIIAVAISDEESREQELLQLHHDVTAAATANENDVFNMTEEEEMQDQEFLKRNSIA